MIDYYETRSQPITRKMVWQAYQEVKSNKGSYGVDQMDWDALDRKLKSHLYKLWNRLSSGSYFPEPVREVAIKKKAGGKRKYQKSFDFLGFTIEPHYTKVKGDAKRILPRCVISKKSVRSVLDKFKKLHKKRVSIEVLAKELNPVIRGVINYYCKFWSSHTHALWNQLNKRLQKWVKWEKGLYKLASVRWLKHKYKNRPDLFAHWRLVRP